MKSYKFALSTLASAAILLAACSRGNGADGSEVAASNSDTNPVDLEALYTPNQLDSITNYPDDMTAGEAAGALKYLYHAVTSSSGNARAIAMRKFSDFYGIVYGNHGSTLLEALSRLNDKEGLDLKAIYDDYTNTLSVGDEAGGVNSDEVKVDTIRTFGDTISTAIVTVN